MPLCGSESARVMYSYSNVRNNCQLYLDHTVTLIPKSLIGGNTKVTHGGRINADRGDFVSPSQFNGDSNE